MVVTLDANLTRKNAFDVVVAVHRHLLNLGIEVIMTDSLREKFSSLSARFLPEREAVKAGELVITVGGDGTIIHSAHFASDYDKPILGINAGNLGFLAGLEKQELTLLENLITGKYTIEKRMMLKVRCFEKNELVCEKYCLNDMVVSRGASMKLCELSVRYAGKELTSYRADGLIVATPTGSTAYSLSAGGPIVDTGIESLILTPVCAHSLFARPLIFKSDAEFEISVKNSESCLPIYSCDGENGIAMNNDSRIIISKAERYTKLIRIKSDSFADILSKKLV